MQIESISLFDIKINVAGNVKNKQKGGRKEVKDPIFFLAAVKFLPIWVLLLAVIIFFPEKETIKK